MSVQCACSEISKRRPNCRSSYEGQNGARVAPMLRPTHSKTRLIRAHSMEDRSPSAVARQPKNLTSVISQMRPPRIVSTTHSIATVTVSHVTTCLPIVAGRANFSSVSFEPVRPSRYRRTNERASERANERPCLKPRPTFRHIAHFSRVNLKRTTAVHWHAVLPRHAYHVACPLHATMPP